MDHSKLNTTGRRHRMACSNLKVPSGTDPSSSPGRRSMETSGSWVTIPSIFTDDDDDDDDDDDETMPEYIHALSVQLSALGRNPAGYFRMKVKLKACEGTAIIIPSPDNTARFNTAFRTATENHEKAAYLAGWLTGVTQGAFDAEKRRLQASHQHAHFLRHLRLVRLACRSSLQRQTTTEKSKGPRKRTSAFCEVQTESGVATSFQGPWLKTFQIPSPSAARKYPAMITKNRNIGSSRDIMSSPALRAETARIHSI
ncbi:hypothetical protein MKZ38_007713 [Zalerion maritima]|uniref:Uncharacterized protein n=1 Tax=Zalerion maritima TaxID=339359 RepID=A0AAD5WMU5_9PEZI|nr:hypothetical protein MKZ38_007713 [Zalerion maritima]